MRIARWVVKYGVIGYVLFGLVKARLDRDDQTSNAWYNNYWSVTSFSRDGQDIPAIITDATRWKRVRFDARTTPPIVRWRFMDDSIGVLYAVAIDETAQTMTLKPSDLEKPKQPAPEVVFHYARTDADHLTHDGKVGDNLLSVKLQRFDPKGMLLTTRGFHWISEAPFNR
jgi:hypothetical protein